MSNWKQFETKEGLQISVDVSEVVVVKKSMWSDSTKPEDSRAGAVLTLKNDIRVDVYGSSYESIEANVRS